MAVVSCLVFDLGGVLVDCVGGWLEACHFAGVSPRPSTNDSGQLPRLFVDFECGRLGEAEFIARLADATTHPPQEIERIIDAWLLGLKAGAQPLLERLRAAALELALFSNTNPRHWRSLTQGHTFSALQPLVLRFASHELGLRKPELRAFAKVQSHLHVPASEVLFFDDLHENVQAARSFGWQAVWVNSPSPVAQIERELRQHGVHV